MIKIKFNEIFDLEICVKEIDKLKLEKILHDNKYRHLWTPSATVKGFYYFEVFNVGIQQCAVIRKLILDAKIIVY